MSRSNEEQAANQGPFRSFVSFRTFRSLDLLCFSDLLVFWIFLVFMDMCFLGLLGIVSLLSLVVLYHVENKVRKTQKVNLLMIKRLFYHFSGYIFQNVVSGAVGEFCYFPLGRAGSIFSHALQLI